MHVTDLLAPPGWPRKSIPVAIRRRSAQKARASITTIASEEAQQLDGSQETPSIRVVTAGALIGGLGIPNAKRWLPNHGKHAGPFSKLTVWNKRDLYTIIEMCLLSTCRLLAPSFGNELYRSCKESHFRGAIISGAAVDGIHTTKKGNVEVRLLRGILRSSFQCKKAFELLHTMGDSRSEEDCLSDDSGSDVGVEADPDPITDPQVSHGRNGIGSGSGLPNGQNLDTRATGRNNLPKLTDISVHRWVQEQQEHCCHVSAFPYRAMLDCTAPCVLKRCRRTS